MSELEQPIHSLPDKEPRVQIPVFGDIILSPPHGSAPMLVVGIAEDKISIDGIRIVDNGDEPRLVLPGTIRVEDIIEIIGHKDRLETAAILARHLAATGPLYDQTLQQILNENPEKE